MILREPFGRGALGEMLQRPKIYNLARMTTETVGTGIITLDEAAKSMLSFDRAGVRDNELITYAIDDGGNREIGYGIYDATAKTLTRELVLKSTNADNPLNLSGNAEIGITVAAEDIYGAIGPRGPDGPQGVAGDVEEAPSSAGHLRKNGAWIPLTTLSGTITTLISFPAANTLVDGPTVDVGNEGTWLVSGVVSIMSGVERHYYVRLWDGTTTIADTSCIVEWAMYFTTAAVSGVITDPVGPLRISVASMGAANGGMYGNNYWSQLAGTHRLNHISAVRIG